MRKLVLAVLCLMLLARPALAQDRLVALIDADPELEHAVSLALSPWGVTAVLTHEPSPGSGLPSAARQAAALCRRLGVSVVVWVSELDEGSLLWIYDAETDEVSTRELSEKPPFTSPAAASVALSLKALLRTTKVAPQVERFGAVPPVHRRPSERLTLELAGKGRFLARDTAEIYGGIGAIWWFRPGPSRLGAGLSFAAGAGTSVETAQFSGRFRESSLSAALTWQIAAGRFVRSSVFGGVTGHFSELSGISTAIGQSADSHRFVPALDAGSDLAFTIASGVYIGCGVKASYLPRPQRYLVQGITVLELWPVAAEFGVKLGVDLL